MSKKSFEQTLAEAIQEIMGSKIGVEVITVPEGSTIEAEMAKRDDPNWCEGCQEVHSDDEAPASQQKALDSIDKRVAELTEAIAIYGKLRASIAKPWAERKPLDMLTEIMMTQRIDQLV